MSSNEATLSGPAEAGERSTLLDGVRGLALLGILVANMVGFSGFFFLPEPVRAALPFPALNGITELLVEWLVVGKFYSLFSLLFGIGFAIQLARLQARGEGVPRYLRRLLVLFLIGLGHILLLWYGDILALYALMGAVLLLFRNARDRTLLWTALICWTIPIGWSAAMHFGGWQPARPITEFAFQMLTRFGITEREVLRVLLSPDFLLHLRSHPADLFFRIADLLYQMRFTKVLGMFLIGLWIGRHLVHQRLDEHAALLRRAARLGLGLGLPISLAKALLDMLGDDDQPWVEFAAEAAYCLGTPLLALGYAAALALLWRAGRRAAIEWAAPAGRMALTNYLMQTVLQCLIFLGFGLGLMSKLALFWVVPLSAAIFALQVAFSRWWLARFRFGPVEWVWRSLTYGRAQPMRRGAAQAAAA